MENFDIVRISSHGEFIDESLYNNNKSAPSSDRNVTFTIYFRGEVGSTVLTRCNTLDTQTIDGKLLCSSSIGRRDFHENMTILYNDGGVVNTTVMECETSMVPDMLLSFDDDDFASGYALYNSDGVPLDCNNNYVSLNKFEINDMELSEIKLNDILKIIYNKLKIKSGSIKIYISSCLYIEPVKLDDIMKTFPDWFECNKNNIIFGYKRELRDADTNINETEANIQVCNNEQQQHETFKTNSQNFIDILENSNEDFKDYVFKYIRTEENRIDSLDELINIYLDNTGEPDKDLPDLQLLKESKKISDEIIQMINKRLNSIESKNVTLRNKITKYTDDLYKFQMERHQLIGAIQNCNGDYRKPAKKAKTANTFVGGKNNNLKGKKKYKTPRRTRKTPRRTRKTPRRTRKTPRRTNKTRRRTNKTPRRTNKTRRRTRKTPRRRT